MRIKLKDGEIRITLRDLVEELSEADRADMLRHLVASPVLFGAVLECVAGGGSMPSFFNESDEPWWFDHETVLKLREKLIPLMPEVAKAIATEALGRRDAAQAELKRFDDWAWKMYHAWPEDYRRYRPDVPEVPRGNVVLAGEV